MGGSDHNIRNPRRLSRARCTALVMSTLTLASTGALVFASPALAASPPVAGDDVARTDSGVTVTVFVTTNDFDPDGDPFSVVAAATPAHGSVEHGGNFVNYTPDPGFSGIDEIVYTVEDSTGASSQGTARVWVDSGVAGPDSPFADDDYSVVYQGATVGITRHRPSCSSNDDDPQGQALIVVGRLRTIHRR